MSEEVVDLIDQEPEVQEDSERIEDIAREMGWRHRDEFEGNDDDYVDASTFIRKGADIQDTMRKHLKEQKKKLEFMESTLSELKTHNERVYKTEVARLKKEITNLQKEKKSAIEEGDSDRVEQIESEIYEISSNIDESNIPSKPAPNPDFEAWLEDNKWYETDPEMADYADTLSEKYKGAPYKRLLSRVTKEVKDMFPDKFEGPKGRSNANTVESTTKRSPGKKFTKRDLSAEQRKVMNDFVSLGATTEEEYINDLVKIGELK
jgi:hypothetical protein